MWAPLKVTTFSRGPKFCLDSSLPRYVLKGDLIKIKFCFFGEGICFEVICFTFYHCEFVNHHLIMNRGCLEPFFSRHQRGSVEIGAYQHLPRGAHWTLKIARIDKSLATIWHPNWNVQAFAIFHGQDSKISKSSAMHWVSVQGGPLQSL